MADMGVIRTRHCLCDTVPDYAGSGVAVPLWKNTPENDTVSQHHVKYSVSSYSLWKVIHQNL